MKAEHKRETLDASFTLKGQGPVSILQFLIPLKCVTFSLYTELFRSPSGISELDCATTKTDMAERSISTGRESLQVFLY